MAPVDRKTVGYVRVSTEEQAREGVSLAAQEERLRAFAVATGRVLSEVIVDDGASAKDLRRDGAQRILTGVREDQIGVVIVLKLDRLTRSIGDLADVLKLFAKHDTALISVSETFDTSTAVGRMMLHLLGVFAQWERETIGERTAFALSHKRRNGQAYSRTPFGYDRKGDTLIPNPAQQRALAMVKRMAAEGATLQQIANELTAKGIAPARGRHWYTSSIYSMLNSKIASEGV